MGAGALGALSATRQQNTLSEKELFAKVPELLNVLTATPFAFVERGRTPISPLGPSPPLPALSLASVAT